MTIKDIFEFIVMRRTLSWDLPPRVKELVFVEPEEPEDVFIGDEEDENVIYVGYGNDEVHLEFNPEEL